MVGNAKLKTVQSLAEFETASAIESRSKLIDEHNAAFRWMVASLFALNGGAIFSMLSGDRFGLAPATPAFWMFFGGIVSTFMTVILAQISDRLMIAQMHQWGLYWTMVRDTGTRDPQTEIEIKERIKRAEVLGRRSRYLAIFAMIWFMTGAFGAAVLKQKSEIERLKTETNERELKLDRLEKKLNQLETISSKR